tara:strand:+ start:1683 stop:2129 length:447 start_codon:yes stop_codon:yes gene_type:complete
MASLISDTEKENLTGIFGDIFDTFKRGITVHKEPKKVVTDVSINQIFGYGNASQTSNVTYIPQSESFHATIAYAITPSEAGDYVSDISSYQHGNIVKIKVEQEARDYIINGKTEKIEFDNRYFNVISKDIVSMFLDVKYYIFYLKAAT